jgi:GDPmannose 4,6-dehydratase
MPKALISGVTGQDGSYLAELLLSKGYEGGRSAAPATTAKSGSSTCLTGQIVAADLLTSTRSRWSCRNRPRRSSPAAQSFVPTSDPAGSHREFTALGVTRICGRSVWHTPA